MFKKLLHATRYSLHGFASAIEHEFAFRLEIFVAALAIPFAIFLGHSGFEKALLIAVLMLVLIVELINSAIEAIVDRISEEKHELSKRAKDLGSAAVFLSCLNVVVVWFYILIWR